MIILVVIVGSFMIRFIPATYALNITSQNDPDNVKVARCIAPLQSSSVSMLVNAQERQNRNVLEAAQQQTETSFIYGGSPAFVYYSGKHVEYYYKVEQYLIDSMKHQLDVYKRQVYTFIKALEESKLKYFVLSLSLIHISLFEIMGFYVFTTT